MKYAIEDLNNGVLKVFATRADAEKELVDLIAEGNAINESCRSECEDAGLDVPKAEDFYSVVEVDENGDII